MTKNPENDAKPTGGVPAGTQLNGIYEIDELIAIGGMGEVYRGHNIQTDDVVAIKIVLPEFAKDETILALFRKEASILNHLSSEAIVRYHVFTVDPVVDRPYLAMEFVDGESLADRLKSGPISLGETCRMIAGVADGLSAAHEAGIIHRDLSPDNIILAGGSVDKAKIIDFGIAKSTDVGGGTLLGGKFAGKYNFVSPEQLGLFGGEITERSDIYAIGLVLTASLLGRPLNMGGSQVEVVEKRRIVPDLSAIDAAVRPIVEAMLQPNPADRPPNMKTVAEWLRQAGASLPDPMIAESAETVISAPLPHPTSDVSQVGRSVAPQSFVSATPFANPSVTPHSQVSVSQTPIPQSPVSQVQGYQPASGIPPHPSMQPFQAPVPQQKPKTGIIAAAIVGLLAVGGAGTYFSGVFEPTIEEKSSETVSAEAQENRTPAKKVDTQKATIPVSEGTPDKKPDDKPELPKEPDLPPEPTKVTELPSEPVKITELTPEPAEVTAQPSEPAKVTAPKPEPIKVTELPPEPAKVTEPTPESAKVTELSPEPAKVTEPAPEPAKVTEPALEVAKVTESTPEPAKPVEIAGVTIGGVEEMGEWILNYDGGNCFYAKAISITENSVDIQGFSNSLAPFEKLQAQFSVLQKFKPKVSLNQIVEPQCATVEFLTDLKLDPAAGPSLKLSSDSVKSGEALQGTLGNLGTDTTFLYLIDYDGVVYSLASFLQQDGDIGKFNIKLVNQATKNRLPQLILTITSKQQLRSAILSSPARSAQLFPKILEEIKAGKIEVGAAVQLFKLGG